MNQPNKEDIQLLVLDMDGVLTDSGIYLFGNGNQARKFNAKDGEGIKQLAKQGIKVAVLTGSKETDIVSTRTKMLNIIPELVSINTADKLEILNKWSEREEIPFKKMAYIGDDLPDIPVLKKVGFSACPNDAANEVKQVVKLVLNKNGGEGCVREFIDYLL